MLKLATRYCDIVADCGIKSYIKDILDNYGIKEFEEYEDELGGAFYVVETAEDLKQIKVLEKDDNGGWNSLYYTEGSFDSAEFLANGRYAAFLMIWNNAGGNTYFIPQEFCNKHVLDSITLTQRAWNPNDSR